MLWSGPSTFMDVLEDLERERTDRVRGAGWISRPRRGRGRSSARRSVAVDHDAGFNQDRPSYTRGERVLHQTFGSGVIVELSGFGPDMRVTVDFADVGRKKLVVRYAELEKDYF